jgi:hypothetical protein
MNMATVLRLERAKRIQGLVLKNEIQFMDPEDGTMTREADFECPSANTPGKAYQGHVGVNGVVYSAECTCPDMWRPDATFPAIKIPQVDGVQVCKHSLAALLKLGWTGS